MSKSNKLPAIQFYPGDWKKDAGVQSLSFHDRGIWLEILFLMHESTERGRLTLNGKAVPLDSLARMIGIDCKLLKKSLTNIIAAGVPDVEEGTGILISRRMVRDENLRQLRKEFGKLGGNPDLLNQNPKIRLTKNQPIEQKKVNQNSSIELTKRQPKDENEDNQNPTPSISFSTSSSDILLDPKDFLKDEIENKGFWMSTRSVLAGYYQSDAHLNKLLNDFCSKFEHEPYNDTKHRVNAFRLWVKNQNDASKSSVQSPTVIPTVAVSKPMGD